MPPDYAPSLPLPPPYDATPKEEGRGSCDLATGTPETGSPEPESSGTTAAPNDNSDLDNHSEEPTA